MNTDKELLELAAKSIGLTLRYNYLGGRDANQPWDPLEDDGDALRLAVELWLSVEFYEHDFERVIVCYSLNRGDVNEIWHEVYEATYEKDRNEATRRAIVRAAAEIGKNAT